MPPNNVISAGDCDGHPMKPQPVFLVRRVRNQRLSQPSRKAET